MTTVLIGGGWDPAYSAAVYGPFLAAAGPSATVACVVIDEGDGTEQFERWRTVLAGVSACRPVAVLVPLGGVLDVRALDGTDALLVCGGLVPAYGSALGPVRDAVRGWAAAGRPYAGFSAGSALAARRAVVGGYRWHGRVVCPGDAGEDLEEISVVDGLGFVPYAVDVHAAQWGTLGRLVAAVSGGLVESGVAIDEDTAVVVEDDDTSRVVGAGAVHVVTRTGAGAEVRSVAAGDLLAVAG